MPFTEEELVELEKSFLTVAEADSSFVEISIQPRGVSRSEMRPGIGIFLKGGRDIPCRVVARCTLGNLTVLTETGYVHQYFPDECD